MKATFDTQAFCIDFQAECKRRNLSVVRVARRYGIQQGTIYRGIKGELSEITVRTMAAMLHFMSQTNIRKYIKEENDSGQGTGSPEAF